MSVFIELKVLYHASFDVFLQTLYGVFFSPLSYSTMKEISSTEMLQKCSWNFHELHVCAKKLIFPLKHQELPPFHALISMQDFTFMNFISFLLFTRFNFIKCSLHLSWFLSFLMDTKCILASPLDVTCEEQTNFTLLVLVSLQFFRWSWWKTLETSFSFEKLVSFSFKARRDFSLGRNLSKIFKGFFSILLLWLQRYSTSRLQWLIRTKKNKAGEVH